MTHSYYWLCYLWLDHIRIGHWALSVRHWVRFHSQHSTPAKINLTRALSGALGKGKCDRLSLHFYISVNTLLLFNATLPAIALTTPTTIPYNHTRVQIHSKPARACLNSKINGRSSPRLFNLRNIFEFVNYSLNMYMP
jgi:hypothetical protein